jgi:hypothetical protein
MSLQDVELWDTLLSSILKTAGKHDVTGLEVLKKLANEMTGKLCVLEKSPICFTIDCV